MSVNWIVSNIASPLVIQLGAQYFIFSIAFYCFCSFSASIGVGLDALVEIRKPHRNRLGNSQCKIRFTVLLTLIYVVHCCCSMGTGDDGRRTGTATTMDGRPQKR